MKTLSKWISSLFLLLLGLGCTGCPGVGSGGSEDDLSEGRFGKAIFKQSTESLILKNDIKNFKTESKKK